MDDDHPGNRGCYGRGCTMPQCVEANRRYIESWRRKNGVKPIRRRVLPRHGVARYANPWRCRCKICCAANTAKCRERRQRKRAEQQPASPPATKIAVYSSEHEMLDALLR